MIKTAQEVLDFWFSDDMQPLWFAKSDHTDARIRATFGDTYDAAQAGRLEEWMEDPDRALALVIVLDQFPRNIHRGHARSFESNDLALRHARTALEQGYDARQPPDRRQFFFLPFMHSEDLADQVRSVELYEALGDPNSLRFARSHHDIIARFGRFPHRNAALNRDSTPEEAEFLKTHAGF
jgi:uncharacterized protein (DUF924 family)